jgi:hypothetical protein
MMKDVATREAYLHWLSLTRVQRQGEGMPLTVGQYAAANHVSTQTLKIWGRKSREAGHFDLQAFLKRPENMEAVAQAMVNGAKGGKNAQMVRTLLQTTGDLVEKSEQKNSIEFTHADRIRLSREIIAGLQDQFQTGQGVCIVCGRPKVLPDKLLLDTKQEHSEDS